MVLVNQAAMMSQPILAQAQPTQRNVNTIGILQDDLHDDIDALREEIYLEVSVVNPITRKEADGELVTTYAIYIETNDSAFTMAKSMVRRRYSEFVALRCILQEQHPSMSVPRLPGRTLLGKRFDQSFIQARCQGLQQFLKAIVEQPVYLSNKSLHLFLQSSLSMAQVAKVVNGGESAELPHNTPQGPLVLCPVDRKRPNDRVGILKQESCASLAPLAATGGAGGNGINGGGGSSGSLYDCGVRCKHQHMRLGSGVVVCPFAADSANTEAHHSGIGIVVGSAPFNIPPAPGGGGSPKASATGSVGGGSGGGHLTVTDGAVTIQSSASNTGLDGAAAGTTPTTTQGTSQQQAAAGSGGSNVTSNGGQLPLAGSLNGSRKKVSFFIEKENRQSLLRRVEAVHKQSSSNGTGAAGATFAATPTPSNVTAVSSKAIPASSTTTTTSASSHVTSSSTSPTLSSTTNTVGDQQTSALALEVAEADASQDHHDGTKTHQEATPNEEEEESQTEEDVPSSCDNSSTCSSVDESQTGDAATSAADLASAADAEDLISASQTVDSIDVVA